MLPEGTVVGLNAWVIHRDQIFGPDADRFRPERWLDADEEHLKAMDRAFIPVRDPMERSLSMEPWFDTLATVRCRI